MITFISKQHSMYPSIAQLVERWTVVVHCQTSIGRWFKSGSKDFFSSTFYDSWTWTWNAAILFFEVKAAICFTAK